MMKTVLIIEYMDFHALLFPVHQEYAASMLNCHHDDIRFVYAVSPKRAKDLTWLDNAEIHVIEPAWQKWLISKSGLRKIYYKWLTQRMLKRYQPDLIIFNTIEASGHRFLPAVLACHAIKTSIVVHNPDKPIYQLFDNSRLRQFLCLNRYNFEYLQHSHNINGYLMCAQPCYKSLTPSPQAGICIAIPGAIDFNRRDYNELIDIANQLKKQNINNITFHIIADPKGKYATDLTKLIANHQLDNFFKLFPHYPSDQEFCQAIMDSDYVMPLIRSDSHYTAGNISGSLIHAAAYKKPIILKQSVLAQIGINEQHAVGYLNANHFASCLLKVDYNAVKLKFEQFINDEIARSHQQLSQLWP